MNYLYLILGCMFAAFAGGMFVNAFSEKANRLLFFVVGMLAFVVGDALIAASNTTF